MGSGRRAGPAPCLSWRPAWPSGSARKKLFYREEGVGRMRSCLPDAELAANLPQLSVPDLVQLLQDLATVGLALPETLVKAEGLYPSWPHNLEASLHGLAVSNCHGD